MNRHILLLVWWDQDIEPVTSVQRRLEEQDYNVTKIGTLSHPSFQEWKSHLKSLVIRHTPIFILIWNRHTDIKAVRDVYSGRIKLFNWDDPWTTINNELCNIDCIDDVYSCSDTKEYYLSHGAKTWTYLAPFYNPEIHYPDFDAHYKCDVSFVCTNLYLDLPVNKVDRSELIMALSREKDITFHLYGPHSISFISPENYRGPIDYTENRKIFTSSKVNISLHIVKGRRYINERCIDILASGGLLLVDANDGMEEMLPNSFVPMLDTVPEILEQIKTLIKADTSPIVKNGLQTVQRFSLNNWVDAILE